MKLKQPTQPRPSVSPDQPAYEPPRIAHKGQIKQFAGSPLAVGPGDPLDILGSGD